MCHIFGVIVVFLLVTSICVEGLSCKDESGNDVDWFFVYKAPKDLGSRHKLGAAGFMYYFLTSSDPSGNLTLSKYSIADPQSIVGKSLQPLWQKKGRESLLYLMYNDQVPDKPAVFEFGHSKGLLLFGPSQNGSGLWLVHSVPHFLNFTDDGYQYPHSGRVNGQVFFCVSYPAAEADKIGHQLLYIHPMVYNFNIPLSVQLNVPNLIAVSKNATITKPPWYSETELMSMEGESLLSFAKFRKFRKDLYSNWIAPTLNTSLLVQSWPIGSKPLPSNCDQPYTMNVEFITLPLSHRHSSNVDHSKWAVSAHSSPPWICVGDLNRMKPQERRGGGAVCMKKMEAWTALHAAVSMLKACPRY